MKFKYLFFLVLFSSHAFADAETENNDSKETSDPLTSGVPMNAQLSGFKDRDWFFVNISEPGILEVTFQNEALFIGRNQWVVEVFDDEDLLLSKKQILTINAETVIQVGIIDAGIHYIKVGPGNGTGSSSFDIHLTDLYSITAFFSEGEPHKDTEISLDCKAIFKDGILNLPCVDVGADEYSAKLKLVPTTGNRLLFEVTDAQPK